MATNKSFSVNNVDIIHRHHSITIYIFIHISQYKTKIYFNNITFCCCCCVFRTNLQSNKLNESDEEDNISSKEQNSIVFENDEPLSDDEQVILL